MERAEIFSNIAEYDPQDESFLEEGFSKFLSQQERLDFNLTHAIDDLVANIEEEFERISELKVMTDFLQSHKKIVPYLKLHKAFTPTFIYDEMKNAKEKIAWQSVSGFVTYLYTNGLLFLKADIIHKASKRNIQLYWIPGTPKRMIVNKLRHFLQVNSKTSFEQQKINSKRSIRANMEAGVEAKKEFVEEETKKHREKQKKQTEERKKTNSEKSVKKKLHEEKKEGMLKMVMNSKPIDYEKKLRDTKIREEGFLRNLPIKELVKGMHSFEFSGMPIWYRELAKKIFRERTGSDIVL